MDSTDDVMAYQFSDFAACEDAGSESDGGDSSMKENTGRWTSLEHRLFLEGLELHGKQWKKIAAMIKTRTVVQIRTHAQKYFQKLAKAKQTGFEGEILMDGRSSFTTSVKRKHGKRKATGAAAAAAAHRDHGASTTVSTRVTRGSVSHADVDEDDSASNNNNTNSNSGASSYSSDENAAPTAGAALSIDAAAAAKVGLFGSPSPTSIVDLEQLVLESHHSKPVTRQRSAIAAAGAAASTAPARSQVFQLAPPPPPTTLMTATPGVQAIFSVSGAAEMNMSVATVGDHAESSDENDLLLEQDALSWLVDAEESALTLEGSTDVDTTSSCTRDGSSIPDCEELGMRLDQQQFTMPVQGQVYDVCASASAYRSDLHSRIAVPASVSQTASLDFPATKRMRMTGSLLYPAPLVIEQPQPFALELTNDAASFSTLQHHAAMNSRAPRKSLTPRALDYQHQSQHHVQQQQQQQQQHQHHPSQSVYQPQQQQLRGSQQYHHQQHPPHQPRQPTHLPPFVHSSTTPTSSAFPHDDLLSPETDAFRVSLDVDAFVSGFLDVLSA